MTSEHRSDKRAETRPSTGRVSRSLERLSRWTKSFFRDPERIKSVLRDERNWLLGRRRAVRVKVDTHHADVSIPVDEPARNAVGLALSGGGIRSATFNLGLLQAFERHKLLWHVDYLSTVSGGGYIGSCLTWFKAIAASRSGTASGETDDFPFGTMRKHHAGLGGKVLAWLRAYGSYLAPGDGLTVWSLMAAVLTGTLVNLLILIPPFLLVFHVLAWDSSSVRQLVESIPRWPAPAPGGTAFVLLLGLGVAALGAAIVLLFMRLLSLTLAWLLTRPGAPPNQGLRRGSGLHAWAAGSAVLGILFVGVGTVPLLLPTFPEYLESTVWSASAGVGYRVSLLMAVAASAAFVVMVAVYVVSTIPRFSRFRTQRFIREWAGRALMYAVLFAAVGTIPLAHGLVVRLSENVVPALSFSGIVSMLTALRGRKEGNEARGWRSLLLSVGLALFSYGVFLWFYHLTRNGFNPAPSAWLWGTLGVSIFLAYFANVNQISMHRYYRNRLMEAYMPATIAGVGWEEVDDFRLGAIERTDGPYHIINANLQTVGSKNPKLRRRGGDNFIFSPQYCGAECTGYAPTRQYIGGSMNLGTAFAISGAAVDPNTYATRSRPLAFLMTLVNARLGYWLPNPKYPIIAQQAKFAFARRPWWYVHMFSEMLGRGLCETNLQVHLSDGGHFENLGLYELIRRRCRYIIVSDAGADPEFAFADLAKAIELVRVDFGAEITIDVEHLRPNDKTRRAKHAFARGTVKYSGIGGEDEARVADLLYIKTTVTDGLTQDIYGYQRAHEKFPDETTSDQFFSEPQFEAYRELGFLLGSRACLHNDVREMDSWFEAIDRYLAELAPAPDKPQQPVGQKAGAGQPEAATKRGRKA